MATANQLNAGVDALRKFADDMIVKDVPSFVQNTAKGYVTDALLLSAVKAVTTAVEAAK